MEFYKPRAVDKSSGCKLNKLFKGVDNKVAYRHINYYKLMHSTSGTTCDESNLAEVA